LISRTSAYALEATIVIAARDDAGPVRAAELAAELDLPTNYLSKILNALTRARLLRSGRGPTGGFSLRVPAREIAIDDIVGVFEDTSAARQCFLGRGVCSDHHSCPMHEDWKRVSGPMFAFLEHTTLADLVARNSAAPASPAKRRTRSSPNPPRRPRSNAPRSKQPRP
jgi:Rrf2 family protein